MEDFLYLVRSAMMLQPNQFALLFTVALLAITAYFLLGSVPLLILKHDNPVGVVGRLHPPKRKKGMPLCSMPS